MKSPEIVDQIHERIFNPLPEITHCSCGHPLGECLQIFVSGEGCRTRDTHYPEFLETVPDWFLIAGMALCKMAVVQFGESPNSEPWD